MSNDLGYLRGGLSQSGSVALLAASEALEEQDIQHSFLAICKDGKWVQNWKMDFDIVSICLGTGKYSTLGVFMGMHGDVLIGDSSGFHMERLSEGADAPNPLRPIHEVGAIGEHLFAVGLRRQVFRRHMGGGAWEKIDRGAFVGDKSKQIAGFLSVDGFDENEVYAVGHGGEIWLFNGKKWKQIESPTNLNLSCVRCTPWGSVFACGAAGVILRGRGNTWVQLEQDITDETVESLAALGGSAYFCTEDGAVFVLHNQTFEQIQIDKKRTVTTGFLASNGTTLLSVGTSDIYTYDSKSWKRLPNPEFEVK